MSTCLFVCLFVCCLSVFFCHLCVCLCVCLLFVCLFVCSQYKLLLLWNKLVSLCTTVLREHPMHMGAVECVVNLMHRLNKVSVKASLCVRAWWTGVLTRLMARWLSLSDGR